MKRMFNKVSIYLLILSLFVIPFGINASAKEVTPMSYPLEVSLSTESSSYPNTEVVRWKVSISGGATTGPNFDVKFTDSKGNNVWAYDLKTYTTSFNMDYNTLGKVTGYVTVYGSGGTVTDSHTITIK